MDFKVDAKSFYKELSFFQKVIDKNSAVPNIDNISFELSGNSLKMVGTNITDTLISFVDVVTKVEGSTCINFFKLLNSVKNLEGEVRLNSKEGWTQVSCGRTKFRISGSSTFPDVAEIPVIDISLDSAILREQIKKVSCVLTKDSSFNTVRLSIVADRCVMTATDGLRAVHAEYFGDFDCIVDTNILISSLPVLESICDNGEILFYCDNNKNYFQSNGKTFYCLKSSKSVPDLEGVLKITYDGESNIDAEEFVKTLNRVSFVVDERRKDLMLLLSEDYAEVSVVNSDGSEASDGLAIDYSGDDKQLYLDYNFLKDFLTVCSGSVSMCYNDSSQIKLESNEIIKFRYIFSEMRIK